MKAPKSKVTVMTCPNVNVLITIKLVLVRWHVNEISIALSVVAVCSVICDVSHT